MKHLVSVLAQDLLHVAATNGLRRTKPLLIRAVVKSISAIGVHIRNERGKRIGNPSEELFTLAERSLFGCARGLFRSAARGIGTVDRVHRRPNQAAEQYRNHPSN